MGFRPRAHTDGPRDGAGRQSPGAIDRGTCWELVKIFSNRKTQEGVARPLLRGGESRVRAGARFLTWLRRFEDGMRQLKREDSCRAGGRYPIFCLRMRWFATQTCQPWTGGLSPGDLVKIWVWTHGPGELRASSRTRHRLGSPRCPKQSRRPWWTS